MVVWVLVGGGGGYLCMAVNEFVQNHHNRALGVEFLIFFGIVSDIALEFTKSS